MSRRRPWSVVWAVGLAVCWRPANAVATLVQTVTNSTVGSATISTAITSTAAGDTIVVYYDWSGSITLATPTDTKGDSASEILSPGADQAIYVFDNVASGNTSVSVTVTGTGAAAPSGIITRVYSGLAASSVDQSASSAVGEGPPSSGTTATLAQANEIVEGFVTNAGTSAVTLGSGFADLANTSPSSGNDLGIEDLTSSSTAGQQATFGGGSAGWVCGVVTFKIAGATSASKGETYCP
jgi:hypothetical protein